MFLRNAALIQLRHAGSEIRRNVFDPRIAFVAVCCLLFTAPVAISPVSAATIKWNSGGSAWLTGGNWVGGSAPAAGDTAQFGGSGAGNPSGSPPTVQINYNNPTNNPLPAAVANKNQAVGAISDEGGSSLTVNSNNGPGVLTLNGATVNGQANTILNMASSSGGNTLRLDNGGSGSNTMGVVLGNTSNFIQSVTNQTVRITSTITQVNSGSSITFLGSGDNSTTGATLRLDTTGTNAFTGGITLGKSDGTGAGVLRVDTTGALPTSGAILVNANSQLLLNAAGTFGGVAQQLTLNGVGPAPLVDDGALKTSLAGVKYQGPVALNTDSIVRVGTSGSLELSGNVSGGGKLRKQGAGELILSGTGNTANGPTQVGNGTLTVQSGSKLPTGDLTMAQTATNNTTLVLNNAAQSVGNLASLWADTSGTAVQNIQLNGTALTITQTLDATFGVGAVPTLTSTITGSGSVILSASSDHKLTLDGTNTYGGGTTVNGGVLDLQATGALPNSGAVFVGSGGQLLLDAAGTFGGASQTATLNGAGSPGSSGAMRTKSGAAVVWAGNVTLGSNSTVTVAGGSGTLTVNGNMSGAFELNKAGQGAIVLAGANPSYSGSTWLTNGSITVNNGSMLGSGALKMGDDSGSNNVTLNLNNSAQTVGSLSQGSASVTRSIALGSATALSIVQTNNETYSGSITGATGSLTLHATSTQALTLDGTNTYGGGTTINGGILQIKESAALPSGGAILVGSGGQLNLDKTSTTFGGTTQQLTLNGDGPTALVDDGALKTTKAGVKFQGPVALNSDSIVRVGSSSSLELSGNLTGGGKLRKQGAGELILSGAGNTANGATQVGNGTLTVQSGSLLGTGNLTMAQTAGNNTTVTLNNAAQSIGSLSSVWSDTSGTQQQTIQLNGTALSITQTADATFGVGSVPTLTSAITGTGSVILSALSTNKLSLTNANTYTGNTNILAGTLALAGAGSIAGSPNVSIAGGAVFDVSAVDGGTYILGTGQTLTGGGTVLGNLVFASGSTLSPGASPGTTDFLGDVTWDGASTYLWEVDNVTGAPGSDLPDGGWDFANITGALDITATPSNRYVIDITTLTHAAHLVGDAANFDPLDGTDYTWTIATALGGITLPDTDPFEDHFTLVDHFTNSHAGTFRIERDGNDVNLVYQSPSAAAESVPEPASAVLAILGLAGLGLWGLRRFPGRGRLTGII